MESNTQDQPTEVEIYYNEALISNWKVAFRDLPPEIQKRVENTHGFAVWRFSKAVDKFKFECKKIFISTFPSEIFRK